MSPALGWGLELPYSIVCRGGSACDPAHASANASSGLIRSVDVVIAAREKPMAGLMRALGMEFPRHRLRSITFWV